MESASLCQHQTCSFPIINQFYLRSHNNLFYLRSHCYGYQQLRMQSGGLSSKQLRFDAAGCVTWTSHLLDELVEEEWMRFGKCKERKGMVELLECLETEAIMGEDKGKEPSDYNRRAQIFDKSSRVFQALKASKSDSQSHQP